jgi:hypothetical protein
MKKCILPNLYILAYHVEPFTLADGDYELIADQTEETPADPGGIVENLTEASNQSSENLDPTAPNRTQEGKPRT